MVGMKLSGGVYIYIVGIDFVCMGENEFYVFEDNV